jgi:hypothetical protein
MPGCPGGLGVFTVRTIKMTSPHQIVLNGTSIPELLALSSITATASRMLLLDGVYDASGTENIPARPDH